jgi:hypothetical protein
MPTPGASQIPTPVRTGGISKTPVSGLPSPSKANSHAAFIPKAGSKDAINRAANRNMPQLNTNDVRMDTAKGATTGDVRMETARGATTYKRGAALQLWEKELIESPEVKRKATVAQLCWYTLLFSPTLTTNFIHKLVFLDFLDYYFQALGYLASRKERRTLFDEDTKRRNVGLLLSLTARLMTLFAM